MSATRELQFIDYEGLKLLLPSSLLNSEKREASEWNSTRVGKSGVNLLHLSFLYFY